MTVAEGLASPLPGDSSSLALIETQGVRRTLLARTGEVLSHSGDGGLTWSRLPAPPLAFASFAGADDAAWVFWPKLRTDGTTELHGSPVMTGEAVLASAVAPGVPSSAATTWDGPVVVFRSSGSQPASLAVVRREAGRWLPPVPLEGSAALSEDEIESAPRLAAWHREVVVAWHAGNGQVLAAFSADSGRSFGKPIEVAAGDPKSRPEGSPALAITESEALVLWSSAGTDGATRLSLARVRPEGQLGDPLEVMRLEPRALAGELGMALAGDRLVVAWQEGEPPQVRLLEVPLELLPAARERKPQQPVPAYSGHGRVGESVPATEVMSLEGERASLAQLRGQPLLLNFWATWCQPCLAEMAELTNLASRYAQAGLVVVAASVDDPAARERVARFTKERQLPFPIWLDPETRLAGDLRVQTLPVTFVIDRQGRILWRQDEPVQPNDPKLETILRLAIGSPAADTTAAP